MGDSLVLFRSKDLMSLIARYLSLKDVFMLQSTCKTLYDEWNAVEEWSYRLGIEQKIRDTFAFQHMLTLRFLRDFLLENATASPLETGGQFTCLGGCGRTFGGTSETNYSRTRNLYHIAHHLSKINKCYDCFRPRLFTPSMADAVVRREVDSLVYAQGSELGEWLQTALLRTWTYAPKTRNNVLTFLPEQAFVFENDVKKAIEKTMEILADAWEESMSTRPEKKIRVRK